MRISLVLLVALLCPLALLGESAEEVEKLKGSIVKITSKAPEGQPQTGTGFIVHVDGELIYIATASHVVQGGDQKPQVTFFHDKRRPVAAEIGTLEEDNPTAGLGYLIVRDRVVAERVKALHWSAETLKAGEDVLAIGFGQGAGEWGVIKGTVASVSGTEIRIGGGIGEGNSGGPIISNGRVAGMVVADKQGFAVGKSGSIVQLTLRGWGVEISAPPRKYASLVGDWLGGAGCTLVFRLDDGKNVEGGCNTGVRHEFAGVYTADDKVQVTITRIDPNQCKTTAQGDIRIENDDTIVVSQNGWDGCQVKTGPAMTRLQRSASP